ncbi:MAG: glutathione S-transferase N-terminal domain-containing protein [Candidatus Gastranaerophilaceae bacterium]
MLDLYVLESCPYSRKVMDFLRDNKIHYHKFDIQNPDNVLRLLTIGGKDQVPFLYNNLTNEKIYESEDIINYLKTVKKG